MIMSEEACPKPNYLRLPMGKIVGVQKLGVEEKARSAKGTGGVAKAAGLRYEAAVKKYLRKELSLVQFGVWWGYSDDLGWRKCQMDGLVEVNGVFTIIEVKGRHTSDAWWQLRRLYEPVLRSLGVEKINLLEVCRSFDPAVAFPEEVELVGDVKEWCAQLREKMGVFSWRQ